MTSMQELIARDEQELRVHDELVVFVDKHKAEIQDDLTLDSIASWKNLDADHIKQIVSDWHGKTVDRIIMYDEGAIKLVFMDSDNQLFKAHLGKVYHLGKSSYKNASWKTSITLPELKRTLKHVRKCADHWNRAVIQIGL